MDPKVQSILTSAGLIIGTILGLLAAMGKISQADASNLQNEIMAAIAACVTLGIALLKLLPHTDANVAKAAAEVPGVTVTVKPLAASKDMVAVANDNNNKVKLAA